MTLREGFQYLISAKESCMLRNKKLKHRGKFSFQEVPSLTFAFSPLSIGSMCKLSAPSNPVSCIEKLV